MNNPETWRPTFSTSTMDYLIWEKETGTSGTIHLQGYVRYKTRRLLTQVSRDFPRGHLSPARGSEEQNILYCSKDRVTAGQDWAEHGTPDLSLRQGRRTDLTSAVECLKEKGIQGVAEEHPETLVKFHAGLEKLALLITPPPPQVCLRTAAIIWGPPGVGKTWAVVHRHPDAYFVIPGRDPWGMYRDQDVIVFDEFHPDQYTIQDMNRWMQPYRTLLSCRYHDKWARWSTVIIISNLNPTGWYYAWPEEIRGSFFRRIAYITEMKERSQVIFTQEIN